MIVLPHAVRAIDRLACFAPWSKREHTCFFNLRPTVGGPGTFARKIKREFQQQGISTTYRRLRSAQAALLFSVSWGDWFYRVCRRWDVHVVLRVDGFMLPSYFDNRPQHEGFQDRRLKLSDMMINYRLQRDLLLADCVIYQSAFSKRMADHFLYNRQEQYAIIFNGVDLQQFSPGSARGGRRRLLSAGSLRDEYMLGTVLPLFEHLWRRYDLELMIVGGLAPICQQQLGDFRIRCPDAAERIKVIGSVDNDDLPDLMRQADVLVHPRLGDWCPNTMIEAMACGLPVVCGSWGGAAELIGAGGVVVSTGEWTYGKKYIADLSNAVVSILDRLDEYRQAARGQAERAFDIREVARSYARCMGLAD